MAIAGSRVMFSDTGHAAAPPGLYQPVRPPPAHLARVAASRRHALFRALVEG